MKQVLWGFLGWILITAVLAGLLYPLVPHSITGWLAFFAAGPVVLFVFAYIVERVQSSLIAQRISLFMDGMSSSGRVAVGVAIGSLLLLSILVGTRVVASHHVTLR